MADRFEMDSTRLAHRLWELGWVGSRFLAGGGEELERALRNYQAWAGLEVDGWAGPVTARSLGVPRFCSLPDCLPMTDVMPKWPKLALTWTLGGPLPHVSPGDQKDAFERAWGAWAAVCGVEPSYTPNAKTADVVADASPIDRGGATLAWSEVPKGDGAPLRQMFDTYEVWSTALSPEPFKVDLMRVACHEIGHALGISHLGMGNLMQPAYDLRICWPQAGDIAEAVARYGPPAGGAVERAVVWAPEPFRVVLEFTGEVVGGVVPGFRLERV